MSKENKKWVKQQKVSEKELPKNTNKENKLSYKLQKS